MGLALQFPRALAAPGKGVPFDAAMVRELARDRARQPYQTPRNKLPPSLADIDYDQYRTLRFIPDQALWRDENSQFEVQFFHPGFLFKEPVTIHQVVDGRSYLIPYDPALFTFDQVTPPVDAADLGFAGFRLHGPINRSDYLDEICAFLGASYFRAVAKGQAYGLSARGLSLKTGDPGGEEFPAFRVFWIERPAENAESIVVHALLDSQSAAAAFRFTIRPGMDTVFDVEMFLYPRVDLEAAGIGTLTSMFYFDSSDRLGIDDYRSAAHDSDGLLMWNGRDEEIWRPLINPAELQFSAFSDVNPRGFGLMQRVRNFDGFQDLEAHYERRPSVWVEPIGNWGEGSITLLEIPTDHEIHDNIVAFWRPREPLRAKGEHVFTYRLHWCWDNPWDSDLARVLRTRTGLNWDRDGRLFVIDVRGGILDTLPPDTPFELAVSATAGEVHNPVVQPNPEIKGWRLSFELLPGDATVAELRAQLRDADRPLSEVWIYRWTA